MGIILLIILAVYVGVVILLAKSVSIPKLKYSIIILAILSPLGYLNKHYVYPSYYQFIELCEAGDRKVIYKVKSVDNLYLGSSSECLEGFNYLSS